MKKALYLLLAVLCLASCQEELSPEFQSDDNVLYASMESIDATRTSMDESNNILWSEEDQIIAFMKTTLGAKYQIKEQYVGTTTGGFSKVQDAGSGDDIDPGQVIDHNVIIYPYSDQVWCMKSDNSTPAKSYKINVVLPETQIYAENSFAEGAFPMVAVSTNNQLSFKNICGALKLQFKGVDKIQSIKLEGLGNEAISGKSSVIAYADGSAPTIAMAAKASTSVILDCGDGVQLNETTPTTFIIAVPPVTFASGMKITVTDTDGLSKTLTNTSSNTIKRSSILNFPVITYKQDGVLEFPENTMTSYDFPAEGGTVEIPVITNLDYEVMIPDNAKDWISVADTKTIREEVITLSVAANSIAATRSAEISVTDSGESVLQTITINQEAAICDIDDSQFNPDLYLRYVSNSYYEGYGDAFDYNMYYYSSYIYNNAFAKASKVEYKFQLASLPESDCYLSVVERGDSVYKIYFNKYGLSIQYNSYSWETLGVDPTDVIVLSFDGNTMNVNGNTFTLNSIRRGGYIFSGYYYDRDDGVYSEYYSFQDNAKLFYAKGWDADGKLIYLGGPAIAVGPSGSDEACWKSVYYYDNRISTQYDFAYYTDQQEYTPYGFGNLLGPEEEIVESTDLSASGTANSYIVSEAGSYNFTTAKGNSSQSVGTIASAEVLWESFGTDVTPNVGDLVRNVKYEDGVISFETPSVYKEGNAVIAAKDANGTILWSWHIWLTDQPEGQVYYHNAGTMMDRNLGAISATPGDVGALGLLYQWGRKDPFLGSSSISNEVEAKSTIHWPSAVSSNSNYGTVGYAIANPTTYIAYNNINYDWLYTGSSLTDNTLWTTSDQSKSIYDPCPAGWRIPDGGPNGLWAKALGISYEFSTSNLYSDENAGINFSGKLGSASTIWYPSAGGRTLSGSIFRVGNNAEYWSASPNDLYSYILIIFYNGSVDPSYCNCHACSSSVRCIKE